MQHTRVWTHSHVHCISLNKVYVCCLYIFFVFSPSFYSLFSVVQNPVKIWASSTETNIAGLSDLLLHHHTAAELLLCSQTQLLHVRIRAGDRGHPPHRWFSSGGEGALCCRPGLLLEAVMGVRECLLADVQTSLKKVSSRGDRGQRRGEAGWGGWGAAGGGSLEGLLPGAML